MPYAFETKKLKLPRTLDRRIKLTEDNKDRIRALYKEGRGIRPIAREYEGKCSRRMIQFVVFPDRAELAKQRLKKWQESNGNARQRVGNEEWARIMKEHRRYKQKLKLSLES